MCETKVIAGILLAIALAGMGLPCWACRRMGADGLVASDLWRKIT